MKKNIIIIFLILTNSGFIVFAMAQRTIAKHQTMIANRQFEITNRYKITIDSVRQKLILQQKTIARQDSIIKEITK